jgi:enamine deaminase RidA (YjgF/YER057c/UK114 family)
MFATRLSTPCQIQECLFLHRKEFFMKRQWITSGSTFEEHIGYSRAVVAGDWVFVSGTTGFDYSNMTISDGVVRVNYVLPNGADFEPCWPVLRQHFGKAKPAAMVITAGLLDPRMKIEIEVTACKAL